MTRKCYHVVLLAAAGLLHGVLPPIVTAAEQAQTGRSLRDLLGEDGSTGFARAVEPRDFHFPADHGPHPAYRSEWWYVTGNLWSSNGRRFGFEWTVFRFALSPLAPSSPSAWATNQVYMGHFAVTDPEGGRFHAHERFARGALGLAGAASPALGERPRVWLEDWELSQQSAGTSWSLRAAAGDVGLELHLRPRKDPVLQGDAGLSRKGAELGNASYYYSLPRLATLGTLRLNGTRFDVRGESWMDREWSTSSLGPEQVGWDWFALQLSDDTELMFYRLRRKDGTTDAHSTGIQIGPRGEARHLGADAVSIEPTGQWRSRHGGVYPSGWQLRVPSENLRLNLNPILEDQEIDGIVRYWEGAVDVEGSRDGQAVSGHGYVELTGYGTQPD